MRFQSSRTRKSKPSSYTPRNRSRKSFDSCSTAPLVPVNGAVDRQIRAILRSSMSNRNDAARRIFDLAASLRIRTRRNGGEEISLLEYLVRLVKWASKKMDAAPSPSSHILVDGLLFNPRSEADILSLIFLLIHKCTTHFDPKRTEASFITYLVSALRNAVVGSLTRSRAAEIPLSQIAWDPDSGDEAEPDRFAWFGEWFGDGRIPNGADGDLLF